jgi:PAS domain S-box-containing protein
MRDNRLDSRSPLDAAALRAIVEGTATETGERFFEALVENLARVLGMHGAWVTEYLEGPRRLRALAFWLDGKPVSEYEYDIAGTPCEPVVTDSCLIHIPENVLQLYPRDADLKAVQAVSYMGVPLMDVDGRVLGHLAVLDTKPMPEDERALALFRIFAARAAAELRRLRAEAEVREREEKLAGLVQSALDAIVEFDDEGTVTLFNPAAEQAFGCAAGEIGSRGFETFLAEESRPTLARLLADLRRRPQGARTVWIPSGLVALRADSSRFPAEATLSCYEMRRRTYFTLILRNADQRLEAERRIRALREETEYLREEIRALQDFDEILGESGSLAAVLHDVRQVAATEATVLILGETGTGKEVIARALHAASRRSEKPLIKVNCAAIPATLIESEFFGHEPGAFTGATKKRDGRFALADGGTIFLDEVGELPLELQPKLLRVLQEGEFEPVGSSKTRRVDVRVIAATNRDLKRAVQEGRFREDLYYRLNVFPVVLPPLRERGEDVVLLARAFTQKFAQRLGRRIEPLSPDDLRRLKAYDWPGNIRELQNVIERAVIISRDGRLNLDRALPETAPLAAKAVVTPADEAPSGVRTAREIEELERANLLKALQTCGWRVAGENGAARLLGLKPSTLTSRMKALKISRPASS